ncbi:Transducin-like enhancer protein 2, partial [Trichinella sp. T6]
LHSAEVKFGGSCACVCVFEDNYPILLFTDKLFDMYPNRHPGPPQTGQPFKFTVVEACDRIKEEFNFLQAQYHSNNTIA